MIGYYKPAKIFRKTFSLQKVFFYHYLEVKINLSSIVLSLHIPEKKLKIVIAIKLYLEFNSFLADIPRYFMYI